MSVDLTFLSDSYTKQILHQLQKTRTQKTDQIRLDLTGERGVLTDRGTDWSAAFLDMGGYML